MSRITRRGGARSSARAGHRRAVRAGRSTVRSGREPRHSSSASAADRPFPVKRSLEVSRETLRLGVWPRSVVRRRDDEVARRLLALAVRLDVVRVVRCSCTTLRSSALIASSVDRRGRSLQRLLGRLVGGRPQRGAALAIAGGVDLHATRGRPSAGTRSGRRGAGSRRSSGRGGRSAAPGRRRRIRASQQPSASSHLDSASMPRPSTISSSNSSHAAQLRVRASRRLSSLSAPPRSLLLLARRRAAGAAA